MSANTRLGKDRQSVPTYQYACTECGNNLEVIQKFTDESLTECPVCHGRLRKVFYPVGVVFKGSGFYRTDSRPAAKEPAGVGSPNGSSEAKSDGAAKSADKAARDGAKSTTESAPRKKAASTPAA
ncbi:MAG TPA: FmdB family zinc ribbon protein [Jiangellaceae bacterium]|nr:FmdB family zinc ribbon protein [Jiangellaceae bacterium]